MRPYLLDFFLESLTLANTMTEIGQDHLLDKICFESLTTLSVECFLRDESRPRHADCDQLRPQKSSLRPGRHASYLPGRVFLFYRAKLVLSREDNQG